MINEISSVGTTIALVTIALALMFQHLPHNNKTVSTRAQEIIFEERALAMASAVLEKEQERNVR